MLDKSMAIVVVALVGIVLSWCVYGFASFLLSTMAVSSVLLSACFMGEPRLLEPFIPLILMYAMVPALLTAQCLLKMTGLMPIMSQEF